MILCVLLNAPFGALADHIGKKKTLIMGRFFLFLSCVGFAFMNSPIDTWIANSLWAVGISFTSGADSALLYTSLKKLGREYEFMKILGKSTGYRLALMSFSSILTGILAEIDLRLPIILCIPFASIPLIISFFFYETNEIKKGENSICFSAYEHWTILKNGFSFALKSKEIRWMIGFSALLGGASKIWFFTYNPYFEAVKIPLSMYGVIFASLNVVAWLSSHYSHLIRQYLSESKMVAIQVILTGFPILLMGLIPHSITAWSVLLQNIVRGYMQPFSSEFMNRTISDEAIRVTVLSVKKSCTDLISIASLSIFGLISGAFSIFSSLTLLGGIVITLGVFSIRSYSALKIRN